MSFPTLPMYALCATLLVFASTPPGIADSPAAGPVDDLYDCIGANSDVLIEGRVSPVKDIPGMPDQGLVNDPVKDRVGLFIEPREADDGVWYQMTGRTGEWIKCEGILLQAIEDKINDAEQATLSVAMAAVEAVEEMQPSPGHDSPPDSSNDAESSG